MTIETTAARCPFNAPARLEWAPNGAVAFANGLRSEIGRKAQRDGAFAPLEKMLSRRGWFLAHPLWQEEKMHFHAWHSDAFMTWPRSGRQEKSDALMDLTSLHEWMHMATLPAGFESAESWRREFRANEIQVSLETEVLVRWRAPGLQHAALGDIAYWADEVEAGHAAWRARPGRAERESLWKARLGQTPGEQIMRDRHAHSFLMGAAPAGLPKDWTPERLWDARRQASLWPMADSAAETQIALYESGSEGWMDQWVDLAPKIESARAALRESLAAGRETEGWTAFSDALTTSMGPLQAPWEEKLLAPGARPTPIVAPVAAKKMRP